MERGGSGAQRLFRSLAGVAGITAEWREREGDVTEIISLHARCTDMVIVGQTEPGQQRG